MALTIVDDAELAGGYAVNGGVGVHHVGALAGRLYAGGQELGGVANLQRDVCGGQLPVDAVEVADGEVLLVGCLRVVAVRDIDDVLVDVLLDDKPGTSTKAHALALSDGVEPVASVLSYLAPRLQLQNVAGHLAQVAAQVVVVVDLAQKADALRVAAVGWCQVFALGYLAHLVFHHVADGEQRFLQLPVVNLCQEVGLVLHGVGAGAEPF